MKNYLMNFQQPTSQPSSQPSMRPSPVPTTSSPTLSPTATPTSVPTPIPTPDPTFIPSAFPSTTRTPSFVPSAMPTPEAGSPTMEPTAKTSQTLNATQVLTGIDVTTAETDEFKTRYAESIKATLSDNVDSILVTSVTATRRHLLQSGVIINYTVTPSNTAVTDIQDALTTTVDALNTEINGYGYTVTAAVPTAFVDTSPSSMPTPSVSAHGQTNKRTDVMIFSVILGISAMLTLM
jgi:hypothetical protein